MFFPLISLYFTTKCFSTRSYKLFLSRRESLGECHNCSHGSLQRSFNLSYHKADQRVANKRWGDLFVLIDKSFYSQKERKEKNNPQKIKLRVKRHGEKNSTIQSFCQIGLMSNGKTMGFDYGSCHV